MFPSRFFFVPFLSAALVLGGTSCKLTLDGSSDVQVCAAGMTPAECGAPPSGAASLSVTDSSSNDFGMTDVDGSSSRTFQVANSGDAAATGLTATFAAPFRYAGGSYPGTGGSCGSALAAGATCTIVLEFAPSSAGAVNGAFLLVFDGTRSVSHSVQGTGKLASGSLDTTFGTNGFVVKDFDFGNEYVVDMVTDGSDNLYVAAQGWGPGQDEYAVAKFGPNGAVDTSFGSNGVVQQDLGSLDLANRIAIDAQGNLYVGGIYNDGTHTYVAVVKFDPTGALDPSFGTGGILRETRVQADFMNGIQSMLVHNGALYVAGQGAHPQTGDGVFFSTRYDLNGVQDVAFNGGDVIFIEMQGYDSANALAIDPADDSILLGGFAGSDVAVVRLDSGGLITGMNTFDLAGSSDQANAIAVDANGKIVLAGSGYDANFIRNGAVVRLNANLSLDATFGSGGKTMVSHFGVDDIYWKLAIQPDGKIVTSGQTKIAANWMVSVARFTSAGALDTTFGEYDSNTHARKGFAKTDFGTPAGFDFGRGLAIQSGGKIVIGVEADEGSLSENYGLCRFTP